MDTRSTLEAESDELSESYEEVTIETTTLDAYIETEGIKTVGLVKIDVEGHELKVLAGARTAIMTQRPYLIAEIESRHHDGNLSKAFESIDILNYSIYYLDKITRRLTLAYDSQGHILISDDAASNIHNYICIPKECENYTETINNALSSAH
jgi:hypothetical protein